MKKTRGLITKFNKVIKQLETDSDSVFTEISKKLVALLNHLLEVRNKYGDVHAKESKLDNQNQAELIVNTTTVLVNYLYGQCKL